jgi:hypothetical protein
MRPLDEQKQGSPLAWQVDASCVLEFSRTPQRSALLPDCDACRWPDRGPFYVMGNVGSFPVKGQFSKFKPFHAHEKGIRTLVSCAAGLTSAFGVRADMTNGGRHFRF